MCSKGCSTPGPTASTPFPLPLPPPLSLSIQYRSRANGYVGRLIRSGFTSPYSLLQSTSNPFTHNSSSLPTFPWLIHFSTACCRSPSLLNNDSNSLFPFTCP